MRNINEPLKRDTEITPNDTTEKARTEGDVKPRTEGEIKTRTEGDVVSFRRDKLAKEREIHTSSALFPEREVQTLHARWDAVQSTFVDEPRKAVEDANEHVFAFFRHFERPPLDISAVDFVDFDEQGSIDRIARARLIKLKNRLAHKLSMGDPGDDKPAGLRDSSKAQGPETANVFTYETRWTGYGSSTDHLGHVAHDEAGEIDSVGAEIEERTGTGPIELIAPGMRQHVVSARSRVRERFQSAPGSISIPRCGRIRNPGRHTTRQIRRSTTGLRVTTTTAPGFQSHHERRSTRLWAQSRDTRRERDVRIGSNAW